MKNESPGGKPSPNIPQEFPNGTIAKAMKQVAVNAAIRDHSDAHNPMNRGDVRTPAPNPDTRPKASAYFNPGGKPKTPVERSTQE